MTPDLPTVIFSVPPPWGGASTLENPYGNDDCGRAPCALMDEGADWSTGCRSPRRAEEESGKPCGLQLIREGFLEEEPWELSDFSTGSQERGFFTAKVTSMTSLLGFASLSVHTVEQMIFPNIVEILSLSEV